MSENTEDEEEDEEEEKKKFLPPYPQNFFAHMSIQ